MVQVVSNIQLDETFRDVNLSVLVNIQSKKKEVLNLVERGHAFFGCAHFKEGKRTIGTVSYTHLTLPTICSV